MTTEAQEDAVRTGGDAPASDLKFVAYYAAESRTPETHERFERVRDRALELLADAGRRGPYDVVDIGCGAGTQAMLWAAAGHRVRALDLNRQLIAIGRERAARARIPLAFEVGSATALPYGEASVDVVLMPELLEHVPEWERCLEEAVRVLRPGGLLYLSTTNRLCPVQQEFELPGYSWYPAFVKRWCERKALTTHPHWVEHARYPAVNWFSYYGLARWLRARGFRTLDRFDLIARRPLGAPARMAIRALRALPPVRLLAHVASPGTTVWAFRGPQ
jgi:2-polyprenyl-6-hydroxyphenyl methylase/3-demethylubiquinone-9 3-methyltransferase